LSDVGLGKACRRPDIPVPSRGYWARTAAGQKLPRPPLAPAKGARKSVTLYGSERPDLPPDDQESAVHPLIAFELDPQNRIAVPDDLRVTHPAIGQTKAYWAAQKRGDVPYADNKLPRLNVSVSKTTLARGFVCCRRCSTHSSNEGTR
jgi:hypothetical protein